MCIISLDSRDETNILHFVFLGDLHVHCYNVLEYPSPLNETMYYLVLYTMRQCNLWCVSNGFVVTLILLLQGLY